MADLRDGFVGLLGDVQTRKHVLKAIREVERENLGLPPPDREAIRRKEAARGARLSNMALPKEAPPQQFSNFLRGPRSRRGQGTGSMDSMFQIDPLDAAEGCTSFWLYGNYKLTQRTLGNTLPTALAMGGIPYNSDAKSPQRDETPPPTRGTRPGTQQSAHRSTHHHNRSVEPDSTFLTALGDDSANRGPSPAITSPLDIDRNVARDIVKQAFLASPLAALLRRRIDGLMSQAVARRRCGVLFDLISTANIIRSGVPHLVGEFVYEYLGTQHSDKMAVKFVFVGITDNANCCAARDVLCRDEFLNGVYVGETKRKELDALDNVHVFAVFPRQGTVKGGFMIPSIGGGFSGGGGGGLSTSVSPTAALLTNMASVAAFTASAGGYVPNKLTPLSDEELRAVEAKLDPDDETSFVHEQIGRRSKSSLSLNEEEVTERVVKIDAKTRRRVFDRRDWAAVKAIPGPSDQPPRPASVSAGMLNNRSSVSMQQRPLRPASRADALGLDMAGFPPDLAAALRSTSGMR